MRVKPNISHCLQKQRTRLENKTKRQPTFCRPMSPQSLSPPPVLINTFPATASDSGQKRGIKLKNKNLIKVILLNTSLT